MQVSKEEILHIAELANLKISDNEVDEYLVNLQDILNYANIVNKVNVEGLNETTGANDNFNVFRKDEIVNFNDKDALLQNAPDQERGMFKIPKVLNS